MTKEEKIKNYCEKYGYSSLIGREHVEYLLARNEELQRRVEKMQAVVEAADRLEIMAWDLVDAIPTKVANGAEKILDTYRQKRDALDAKEQGDGNFKP